jgi:VanZ family protein
MAMIFVASGDSMSSQRSSRILEPLIHWLFPSLSPDAVAAAVFWIRKSAHLAEYAVLALLFWRARRKPVPKDPRPWSWREAWFALLCVALYAASDEFHQLFVPTREGKLHDVAIDSLGAVFGLVVLWALMKMRRKVAVCAASR